MDAPADARVILFGTSRLHRPFARHEVSGPRINYPDAAEPVFMRMGYFHGIAEVAQVIEALIGVRGIPKSVLPFVFRVENRTTTPRNEFDATLASAIRGGREFAIDEPARIHDGHVIVVEISSLRRNVHTETGAVLHTNPNFLHQVSYSEIYPDGYYQRFAPWLRVDSSRESEASLVNGMTNVRKALPGVPLIVLGHLASERHPQGERFAQNAIVAAAAEKSGAIYFDVGPFVDEYGFAEVNGRPDFHHLSLRGEDALGERLLREATSVREFKVCR